MNTMRWWWLSEEHHEKAACHFLLTVFHVIYIFVSFFSFNWFSTFKKKTYTEEEIVFYKVKSIGYTIRYLNKQKKKMGNVIYEYGKYPCVMLTH